MQKAINNKAILYRQLQEHLNKLPIGFPCTKSGVELKILEHLFNPFETKLALCLSLGNSSVKTVQKRMKRKFNEEHGLESISNNLDSMYLSGSINRSKNKPYKYSNAMLAIGMFEFQLGNLSKEFMELLHQYFDEGFNDEFFRSSLPQLRASPHINAIVPEYNIATYDNMRKVVTESKQTIAVANCVCKEGEALLGKTCKQTSNIEVCISFGASAYLDRGQARVISKDECLEILDRAESEGLVLQPGNSLQPFCICLCCGCCCGVLTSAKKYGKPSELIAHNYFARINAELCNGCSFCVERCQTEAIHMDDKKSVIDLDRCIGCGLCVVTCKKEAIHLTEKKTKTVPPKNAVMLYLGILSEKVGKQRMIGNMLKLLLGKQL